MDTISAAFLLFLVMDPVGNVPLFLSALKSVEPRRQIRVLARELTIAYTVLVLFLFAGQYLLRMLRISEPALTIAGGLVLFLIALRLVFPTHERTMHESIDGEPFVVPLAIPYLAGPSALATVVLLMSREPSRWPEWLAGLSLAWGASAIILIGGSGLKRFLGQKGLIALERLMGMILVAVAVEMFLAGIREAI